MWFYEQVDSDRVYRYESYEESMERLDRERGERMQEWIKECGDD